MKEEERKTLREKKKDDESVVGLLVRRILLHLGLVGLCVVYVLFGAMVFLMIEKPVELDVRSQGLKKLNDSKNKLQEQLWNLRNDKRLSESDKNRQAESFVDKYMEEMFKLFPNSYLETVFDTLERGGDMTQIEDQWTFKNAVLLAVTTVTTVGYGYVTPKTKLGRIFCVFYGLIGIPLSIVTIADLGRFLGLGISTAWDNTKIIARNIWNKMRSPGLSGKKSKRMRKRRSTTISEGMGSAALALVKDIPIALTLVILISYPIVGGCIFWYCGEYNYLDMVYYSFVTIFTIGFGDIFVGHHPVCFIAVILYLTLGVILVTMSVDLMQALCLKMQTDLADARQMRKLQMLSLVHRMSTYHPMAGLEPLDPRSLRERRQKSFAQHLQNGRFPGAFDPYLTDMDEHGKKKHVSYVDENIDHIDAHSRNSIDDLVL